MNTIASLVNEEVKYKMHKHLYFLYIYTYIYLEYSHDNNFHIAILLCQNIMLKYN